MTKLGNIYAQVGQDQADAAYLANAGQFVMLSGYIGGANSIAGQLSTTKPSVFGFG